MGRMLPFSFAAAFMASVMVTPAAAVSVDAIPQAFQGRWEEAAQFCNQPSDATLTLSANKLQGWEATGEVTAVEVVSARQIIVTSTYSGEGETWESTERYQLSGDGQTLTTSTDRFSFQRVRCPQG